MRTFALKNADTNERYSLMSVNHYFSDPAGLGTNYDISGVNTGNTFVVASKRRAINAPSGNMIFSNYNEYNKFIEFCNCERLQFCYSPNGKERMMDVSLASCEKTEAAANGMLTCPVTFNGLSWWYIEEIIDKPFRAFDALLDTAKFSKNDLLHLGKQGYDSEISLSIRFDYDLAETCYLMELGLVYYEQRMGTEIEHRDLIFSIGDYEFHWGDGTVERLVIDSSPQNLSVFHEKFGDRPQTANIRERTDLYRLLDPNGNNPFIRTKNDVYLFACAVDDDGNRKILGVEARCKRFVESV